MTVTNPSVSELISINIEDWHDHPIKLIHHRGDGSVFSVFGQHLFITVHATLGQFIACVAGVEERETGERRKDACNKDPLLFISAGNQPRVKAQLT